MTRGFDLSTYGLSAPDVLRNVSLGLLYEDGLVCDGDWITSTGALATSSGDHTQSSPDDFRMVEFADVAADLDRNTAIAVLTEKSFAGVRKQAIDFLNTCGRLYVVDGLLGWNASCRFKVRVICARPYHAVFMRNLLIRPTAAELAAFGTPDITILNAGQAPADPKTPGLTSATCVAVNLETHEVVILGSELATEMRCGLFALIEHLLPKRDALSLRAAATEGQAGDVSLFLGPDGSGKSTLAIESDRRLIADDLIGWTNTGIFGFEAGCQVGCLNHTASNHPELHRAVRFGTVLENVAVGSMSRDVDFADDTLTNDPQAAFPMEFLSLAKIPCIGAAPSNLILLTCDVFGVLPPVSRLTTDQAVYYFMSGYSATFPHTESGTGEPQPTFVPCSGATSQVWQPGFYADLLVERLRKQPVRVWLVNTGWTGGSYGTGERIDVAHTKAIVGAIHAGTLCNAPVTSDPVFGLECPEEIAGVPSSILVPELAWTDAAAFRQAAGELAERFRQNCRGFADYVSPAVIDAGPRPRPVMSEH